MQSRALDSILTILTDSLRSCSDFSLDPIENSARCVAIIFLACFSTKTKVFITNDLETLSQVENLLSQDGKRGQCPTKISDELVCSIAELPSFASCLIPNALFFIFHCLHAAIRVASSQKRKGVTEEELESVLNFLEEVTNVREPYWSGPIQRLEEGAFTYDGPGGILQIGIPPETIKASMLQGKNVPQVFVFPPPIYKSDSSIVEVEFPVYFNFFIKNAFKNPEFRVKFIGTRDQIDRAKIAFNESMFGPGPQHIYVKDEIDPEKAAQGYWIDFHKERNFLAYKDGGGKQPSTDHFADFIYFDEEARSVTFHQKHSERNVDIKIEIQWHKGGGLRIFEEGEHKATLDTSFFGRRQERASFSEEFQGTSRSAFDPPVLGVTFIGTSHGFDPKGRTTGFIVWVNGKGVLVDPPIQTGAFLRASGIHRKFVNKAILTHCHSDHDSGLLSRILEGEKIEVYTTKTIIESYKRKMNAITGRKDIGEFFVFKPVPIGRPVPINGAMWEFDYSLHTIPTIRFRLSYNGKSISYSSDTYYSPRGYTQLVEQGVINYQRDISLRLFTFCADLIIHESGVPPIHTDLSELNDLPDNVKDRMLIVHCSSIPEYVNKAIDKDRTLKVKVTKLRIPETGVDKTVSLSVGPYNEGFSKASRVFQTFCSVFYFRKLTPPKLNELFSSLEELHVLEGATIIHQGQVADKFYLIESGQVDVYTEIVVSLTGENGNLCQARESKLLLSLVRGDYFGENALYYGDRHSKTLASVVAATDCTFLVLPRSKFLEIIHGQDKHGKQLEQLQLPMQVDLDNVRKYRPFVRDSLMKSFLFSSLQSDQIEEIASIIDQEQFFSKDDVIIKQGDDDDPSMFLIKDGQVRLEKTNPDINPVRPVEFLRLGPGDTFGEIALITGLARTASAVAHSESVVVLQLRREPLFQLMDLYQNMRFHILTAVEQRLHDTKAIDQQISRRQTFVGSPRKSSPGGSAISTRNRTDTDPLLLG